MQPLLALRLAFVGLRRSAATSGLAMGILALGLALPAVFFSILVGSIRPLPVPDGDRIIRVDVTRAATAGAVLAVLPQDLARVEVPATLSELGGFRTFSGTLLDPGSAATRVPAAALTPAVFDLLQVQPSMGRIPTLEEADHTLLIGHRVWTEGYAADPEILGRLVEVNGVERTIVAVMPDRFGFPFNEGAWILLDPSEASAEPVELVARLAPGASLAAAEADYAARWSQVDPARIEARRGGQVEVQAFTGGRGEGGEAVAFIGLVLIALCLLLIACANVANLLLVRAAERVRALGIQSALGAGRWQIGMQLFFEAGLLSLTGGVVGLVLARAVVDTLQTRLAAEHWGYHWMVMAVDGRVLTFVGLLVLGTALVAGMLPVVRVLKVDILRVLKDESGAGAVAGGGAWGRVFVTTQLALSCAALVAAGLTARSMNGARGFGSELEAEAVLVASIASPTEAEGDLPQSTIDLLLDRVEAIPGASSAAAAVGSPGFFEPYGTFEFDAIPVDRASDRARGNWNAITPGYFTVFGIEVLAGRALLDTDVDGSTPVIVVNESWVRRFSPDRDVLGRSVRIQSAGAVTDWHTVVGVVSDARVAEGDRIRHDRIYLPLGQAGAESAQLLLRGSGDASGLAPALRAAVFEVDPTIALLSTRTLDDAYAFLTRIPRAMGAMAIAGGLAGLMVAAVGLYGLLAFRIRQRRAELGVRLAMGADGYRLARETLGFALRQLLPAVAIGLALAWLAAPILAVLLLGPDPRSPSTFAGVGIVFLAVGLIAAGVPAWRASLTDPARVLRGQ